MLWEESAVIIHTSVRWAASACPLRERLSELSVSVFRMSAVSRVARVPFDADSSGFWAGRWLIKLQGMALPANPSHRIHRRISPTSLPYIGNRDIRAGGSKSLGNCSPNVAGASGHERNFSLEIHGDPPVATSVNS